MNLDSSHESKHSVPPSNGAACGACVTVKSDLKKLEQEFNELRNLVLSKVNMQIGITTPKENKLQKENSDLREELNKLRDQLDTERVVLAKANEKIRNLENERDSLITALKLINDDLDGVPWVPGLFLASGSAGGAIET
ncbi:hypothetical protein OS493_036190 [Desmophyllum pertusum]|uniref:Uncharacterized protein n=1 Tax=Desmophyllum pertusum TaxID=174260 RepID=A0A9W9YY30_9CNID|nr:hypothetical protein OS493_036190 [Desmophyllum pertusum]